MSIKHDTEANQIALSQDNAVCELTVEPKVLQVGRYINELAGREKTDLERTALELLTQVTSQCPAIWFLLCWDHEPDSFVHVSLRAQRRVLAEQLVNSLGFFAFAGRNCQK